MSRTDIPLWGWYTGQLLLKLERGQQTHSEQPVASFMKEFVEENGIQVLAPYPTMNPGTIMMLMYALLVVPREVWEAQSASFPFTTRASFTVTLGETKLSDNGTLLRLLRNSVSHANYSMDPNSRSITFWNETSQGTKNFETTIGIESLGEFLTEVSKYFINVVRKGNNG